MDKGIEALIARKGNAVTGNYYLAECGNCSEMFPIERMTGGEALYAGDYGDCYCPHCGAADCEISDYGDILSNAGLAWNYQQKHIDALISALDQAQRYAKKRDEENVDLMMTIGRLRVERESLDLAIREPSSLCAKSNDAMREVAPLCVKLPMPYDINVAGERVDWEKGDHFDRDEVIEAIRAAGGTVEGSE